jgi:hypothetical protein
MFYSEDGSDPMQSGAGLGVNEMLDEHHRKVCRWLCRVG